MNDRMLLYKYWAELILVVLELALIAYQFLRR